ncbi:hypothetical protein ACPOL_2969 [Acidisarcina polymorpha]|uniref:Uncharacterized protein n=1 Tax=Acidisarcina polymorpha TaxID=2211140 RepID=A0A2Z5FZG6_9BACT|nr:hypothetical protein ACPOL_2969 [Acidisarcina polymorpha]
MLIFFLSGILRMYARTNSLAIFKSSSARQTSHFFTFRLASLSGRTVTPLRARSKAPEAGLKLNTTDRAAVTRQEHHP